LLYRHIDSTNEANMLMTDESCKSLYLFSSNGWL